MNQWIGRGSCAYKYLIATWRNEEMNNQKPVIIFEKLYINVEKKTLSLFYVCVCTWYAIDVIAFRLYSIYYVDRLFLLWLYVGRAQQTSPKIINIYRMDYLRRFLYLISYSWLFLYILLPWTVWLGSVCLCWFLYSVHRTSQLNYTFKSILGTRLISSK